jgi:hypothetical protein
MKSKQWHRQLATGYSLERGKSGSTSKRQGTAAAAAAAQSDTSNMIVSVVAQWNHDMHTCRQLLCTLGAMYTPAYMAETKDACCQGFIEWQRASCALNCG